ncbi:cupin domain-containing protein [Methylobacterium sp. NEAU 140]|uniref:cupin domain-containing protein n=1 Tax=Methylobacterium sp. NEAU 140 TaxID=3064945 RepID=UPI0027333025|nr:cupin domain-containing protein [Methylobacterium sp. NEAU 140]MDP4025843.1 cupin domain-containing protein [Methylobacterium sp. NEAU 140]
MKHHRLDEMTKGWFVGDFAPAALRSPDVEVGVKHYTAGDREGEHLHRVATELTLIVSGSVVMCGRSWGPGDIVTVEPGEATAFEAITDCVTVVVKLPSVMGDKYPTAAAAE